MPSELGSDEEIRRLEKHYEVNPDGLVFARLADAYRRSGRTERALALLEEGLEQHPDYTTAHLVRGRALLDVGRPEEATRAFERAVELDADNRVALRALRDLAEGRGDDEEASRWRSRLQGADPEPERESAPVTGSPESEEELAREIAAMADDGWWSRGDGESEEEEEVVTETMARLYERQGLLEEAAAVYEELLERRPGDDDLARRLRDLRARASGEAPSSGDAAEAERGPTAGSDGRSEEGPAAREHLLALLRGEGGSA